MARMKVKGKAGKHWVPNREETRAVSTIDKLAAYEAFQEMVPKALREALLRGDAPDKLYKDHASIAAARVVQILTTEADSGKALAAAKELLDRVYGKATERKEVTHKYQDLSDEELEAILLSEVEDIEADE